MKSANADHWATDVDVFGDQRSLQEANVGESWKSSSVQLAAVGFLESSSVTFDMLPFGEEQRPPSTDHCKLSWTAKGEAPRGDRSLSASSYSTSRVIPLCAVI
ncbi:hypothetical protein FKM82_018271 [Ascaphus truei]